MLCAEAVGDGGSEDTDLFPCQGAVLHGLKGGEIILRRIAIVGIQHRLPDGVLRLPEDAFHIGALYVEHFRQDHSHIPDPVEDLCQRLHVAESVILAEDRSAGGRYIVERLRTAQSFRHVIRGIVKCHSQHADMLEVLLQRRREGQIPERGGDDDPVCPCELPGQVEFRVRPVLRRDASVAPSQEILIRLPEFDL